MAQKEPGLIEFTATPETLREEAQTILNKVNQRRAEVLALHLGAEAQQILEYLQADKFEDIPPSFYPIIESILTGVLEDPTFGASESSGPELFAATMDLGDIGSHDGIPPDYQSIIREADAQVSLRNMVAFARTMALLYQQYENHAPETDIKKFVLEETARYCATNRIATPTEILKNIDTQAMNQIIRLWKQQEVKHQTAVHEEIMEADRLGNHIKEGALPASALFNSRQVQDSIMAIMNQANPDAADKKRAAIYAKHAETTQEKNRKFYSFYNFVKGSECFTERLFRFQEGVIDIDNF